MPLRIIILLLSLSTFAHSQKYPRINNIFPSHELEEIETAVNLFWKWDGDEDPINAVKLLKKISKKYPNNWLAPYWASYISTQIANSIENKKNYLHIAQTYFDKADLIFVSTKDSVTYSYFEGLQSLIFRLKMFNSTNDDKKKNYQKKAINRLNNALSLNPNNPVLWVLLATQSKLNFKDNMGDRISSIIILQNAEKEFDLIENRGPAEISYWNEHWIKPWLRRLKPSHMN